MRNRSIHVGDSIMVYIKTPYNNPNFHIEYIVTKSAGANYYLKKVEPNQKSLIHTITSINLSIISKVRENLNLEAISYRESDVFIFGALDGLERYLNLLEGLTGFPVEISYTNKTKIHTNGSAGCYDTTFGSGNLNSPLTQTNNDNNKINQNIFDVRVSSDQVRGISEQGGNPVQARRSKINITVGHLSN